MKPISFPNANTIIGGKVPANRNYGIILTRWEASWRERLKILWHGTIWVSVVGDAMPPMLVSGDQVFQIQNPPGKFAGWQDT